MYDCIHAYVLATVFRCILAPMLSFIRKLPIFLAKCLRHIFTYMTACTQTYFCIFAHTNTHTTHTHERAHTHAQRTHAHTNTHTHTHTHTHTNACIYTYIQAQFVSPSSIACVHAPNDPAGFDLIVADTKGCSVRKITRGAPVL